MDGKSAVCQLCEPPKTFSNSYVCQNHNMTVHQGKKDRFKCEICSNMYATKYKLMRHVQGVHSERRDYRCSFCDKSFKTRDVMLKHQRIHEPAVGPFVCTVCDSTFKFKTGLDYHLRRIHKEPIEDAAQLESEQLEVEFGEIIEKTEDCVNFEYVEEHVECQQDATSDQFEEVFIAPKGNLSYQVLDEESKLLEQIDEDYVMVEKITMVVDEEEPQDEECIDQYITNDELSADQNDDDIFNQFIEEDIDLDDVSMICFDADENKSESSQKSKNLSCSLCGTSFKSKSNLNRHIQRKHEENSHKVVCQICDKKFLLEFDLRRHLLSHDSAKNFSCTKCRKTFKTIRSLQQHQALLHSNTPRSEKSFQCPHCDRTYFHKRHLGYHLRKHAKEKMFSCDQCSLNFHYKEAHKWHNIRVHGEPAPFNCRKCRKKFLHQKAHEDHNENQCREAIIIDNQKKFTK